MSQGDVNGGPGNDSMVNVVTNEGDIDGGSGNDGIINSEASGGSIDLGPGNDEMVKGAAFGNSIFGGAGNDQMANVLALPSSSGLGGSIDLGTGNDGALFGIAAGGPILSGAGNDTITAVSFDGLGDIIGSVIDGGAGNDTLTGTAVDDTIRGGRGPNLLRAGGILSDTRQFSERITGKLIGDRAASLKRWTLAGLYQGRNGLSAGSGVPPMMTSLLSARTSGGRRGHPQADLGVGAPVGDVGLVAVMPAAVRMLPLAMGLGVRTFNLAFWIGQIRALYAVSRPSVGSADRMLRIPWRGRRSPHGPSS